MKNDIKIPIRGEMLIIHQGALGDFILSLPVLETLRRLNNHSKIYIMGYPRILELVENRFYADEILSIDQKGMATFFVKDGSLDPMLSQFFKKFELLVIFGKDGESIFIKNLRRVSKGNIIHINSFPSWGERIHLTDHLLRELSKYGFRPFTSNPKLYLNKRDREWAQKFWEAKGIEYKEQREFIAIHPGSGSRKKVWPIDKFLSISKYIEEHLKGKIILIIGPAESGEIQKLFENKDFNNLIVAKGLSLIQLASIIECCKLFIGNDSGISHMASALGVPTIAIFGPTDPKVWSPRGENVSIIKKEIPCSPCPEERFFQCKDLICLNGIEQEDVLQVIERVGFS